MTEKRCKNCYMYSYEERFCYLRWECMDTLEYCNEFKIDIRLR